MSDQAFQDFQDTMHELRTLAYKSAHLSVHILIPKFKRGRIVTFRKLGWMGDTSDLPNPYGEESDEECD